MRRGAGAVTVEGLRELGAALKTLSSKEARTAMGKSTGAGASVVKKAARQKVKGSSYDTGDLHRAIIVRKLSQREAAGHGLSAEAIVTVRGRSKGGKIRKVRQGGRWVTQGDSAPYGAIVEFGADHMPAEPYLRPALQQNTGPATEEMRKSLGRAIDLITGKIPKKVRKKQKGGS